MKSCAFSLRCRACARAHVRASHRRSCSAQRARLPLARALCYYNGKGNCTPQGKIKMVASARSAEAIYTNGAQALYFSFYVRRCVPRALCALACSARSCKPLNRNCLQAGAPPRAESKKTQQLFCFSALAPPYAGGGRSTIPLKRVAYLYLLDFF